MQFDPEKITFFAKTDARGKNVPFGIKAKDRQRHMYVVGKTGMGKSTLLENMAAQDILNGEGVAFIDPHGSAAETLLDYVPEHRIDDVVYFAPFDLENPISFNVMEDVGPDKRHLVVSGLMSTFKKIWVDAWSARMEYILTNALLALIEYPDTTLLSVNRLFSDKAYREKVVDHIKDPAVKSFWVDEFANYTERFAAEALPAIQNKIGQFTGNPLIRNIIGQPHSSFDIRKIMDEKKILIMNLSKGLVGETNANLLGSMLTTRIYLAAMSRADLPVAQMKQMPNFYFYVDEFQSFANTTFANILSEARKYHLNLIIAHQYIEQMEEEVRDAVFGNVGTTITFRVGPFDAETLETVFTPTFLAADLVNLGFAQIYLTLMIDGIGSQPFSATTLPPIATPPVSCKHMVIAASRKNYTKPRVVVEKVVHDLHASQSPAMTGAKKGKSKRQSDSGPDKKRTNTPDRQQQAPSHQSHATPESRTSNRQEQSHTKPTPQVSVDDLKSILARISQESGGVTGGKKTASADNKPHTKNQQRDNRPRKPEYKEQSHRSDTRIDSKQDKAAPVATNTTLKEALAQALTGAATGREPKQETTPAMATSNAPHKPRAKHTPKPAPVPRSQPAQPSPPVESVQQTSSAAAERAQFEAMAKEAEARFAALEKQENQSVHPKNQLDVKTLERMMRTPPTDRNPFQ